MVLSGTYPKLVFGRPATGKSLTMKWLAKQHPELVVYVDCDTSLRSSMAAVVGGIRANGKVALEEFFSNNESKTLILDDIQKLMTYHRGQLSYDLQTIHDSFPDRRIVLVTNLQPRVLLSTLKGDAKTRFEACERVIFSDYDADEARAIIRQRFDIANFKVDNSVVSLLAGRYVNGDLALRDIFRTLDSLHKSGKSFDLATIEQALNNKLVLDFAQDFLTMPVKNAIVLGVVSFLQAKSLGEPASRGAVINTASDFFNLIGAGVPSNTTYSRIIDQLVDEGHLNSQAEMNKRGRPASLGCKAGFESVYAGFKRWLNDRYELEPRQIEEL